MNAQIRMVTHKFFLRALNFVDKNRQFGTLQNNLLHGFVPANPFRQFKLHGILVLRYTRNNTNVVCTHIEVIPWIWKMISLPNILLRRDTVNVVVQLLSESLCGTRSKALSEISEDRIKHLHSTSGTWWRRVHGIRTETIVNTLVRLSATL